MIDWYAHLFVQRIPLEQLKVGEAVERHPRRIVRYAKLLIEQPRHDMEPMLVEPVPGGYRIINGHHRFCAYIIAGRAEALCLVLR